MWLIVVTAVLLTPRKMDVWGIIWLSMASAACSFTVSEAIIFKPFRTWLQKKGDFLCRLFSCFYCLGFWVSFILEAIFQPNLFSIPIIGHILTSFIIAWISGLQGVIMIILMKKADK
jgi:uncharacterized membrane protein (DUF485 family)